MKKNVCVQTMLNQKRSVIAKKSCIEKVPHWEKERDQKEGLLLSFPKTTALRKERDQKEELYSGDKK